VCFVIECILVFDGLRDGGEENAHVFFERHRCAEIKVFEIEGGEAGAGSRDDAVYELFYCG
jgi:hypothetical protein